MSPWALLVAAYILGAVPSSYIAGRLRGVDLRKEGSGNLGATNAFRVLGAKYALPVVIGDILKGWVPAALFASADTSTAPGWALAYGAAAVLGHTFSPFVGFRGGKGVATGAGVLLALAPLGLLTGVLVFAVVVAATRIVSVGSMAAAVTVPVVIYATGGPAAVFWLACGLAVFIFITHRQNIRRLLRGQEHRLGSRVRQHG